MGRNKKDQTEEVENNNNNQDVSKNLLGSLLNGYKDSHYNFIEPKRRRIPSGSLLLDSYISLKSGSTMRVGGSQAESGKSSQCLLFAKNYMSVMEKSKTFLVNSEARLSEELQSRSGLKFVNTAEEWDYGTVFVLHSNYMETACQMLETMLKSMYEQGEYLCIIIDSIDMLTLTTNLVDKKFGENTKLAGVQFLTKELFRRIGHAINRYDALLLVTSQYSSSISADPYGPKEPPKLMQGTSANGLNHMSDYAIYYRPRYQGDFILQDENQKPDPIKNKILGVFATVEIKKSATDVTGTVIKIPIKKSKTGGGIWRSKEVGDMILSWSLATKSGAWISFSDSIKQQAKEEKIELREKIQGLTSLYDYLEQDEKICDWFYEKFKNLNES